MELFFSKTSGSRARAVGVLASSFAEPYMLRILQGAIDELRRSEFSTVCFDGGFPGAPLFRNADGDPVLPSPIDGWIVLPETLHSATAELGRALIGSARPAVSIGIELPGATTIAASDESGVFQAVAHLVRRHSRTRIAFIAGPETSVDASRRREGYQFALETLKIEADPALLVVGDYEARSGSEAVRQLVRQKVPFDAIVAANDLMAIGAMESLQRRGLRVPEDVSVVGFDDMEEASFASPPLTTVRQPLYEHGQSAARDLVRAISGSAAEASRTMGTTPLVLRRSCGCRDSAGNLAPPPRVEVSKDQWIVEGALRERVRQELARARRQRALSRLAGDILRAGDMPDLCPAMTSITGILELRRMAMCAYAGAQRHARVVLESTGRHAVFHHLSQSFSVEQALPPAYLKHDAPVELSIGPLEIADEHVGYLVLEGDLQRALSYLELRRHLGSALGRMTHTRELRRLYGERRRSSPPSGPPPPRE